MHPGTSRQALYCTYLGYASSFSTHSNTHFECNQIIKWPLSVNRYRYTTIIMLQTGHTAPFSIQLNCCSFKPVWLDLSGIAQWVELVARMQCLLPNTLPSLRDISGNVMSSITAFQHFISTKETLVLYILDVSSLTNVKIKRSERVDFFLCRFDPSNPPYPLFFVALCTSCISPSRTTNTTPNNFEPTYSDPVYQYIINA